MSESNKPSLDRAPRRSGLELLKILAIFLIVLFHVVQTLSENHAQFPEVPWYLLTRATHDAQRLTLMWFSSFGNLGNLVFLGCSAWFLLESRSVKPRKVFRVIADVWVVSFAILAVMLAGGKYRITLSMAVQSLIPTTMGLYWYITCYLLLYLIHPALNFILDRLSQRQLLGADLMLLILYYGLGFVKRSLFFSSRLVLFIAVYFVFAYVKRYMPVFCASRGKNLGLLLAGGLGVPTFILAVDLLALRFPVLEGFLLHA